MREVAIASLTETIPSESIFSHMTSLSFVQSNTVAEYLDAEYFSNYSGNKQASPLAVRWSGQPDQLAALILNRYRVKWENLFRDYSSLDTINLLDNIKLVTKMEHGKAVSHISSDAFVSNAVRDTNEEKSDSSSTIDSESIDPENPRSSTRSITGGYTDSGTAVNTRTGTQTVTDKGGTMSSIYGYNSENPVPSLLVAPESELGTTSETSYGEDGLKDSETSGNTRTYTDYKDALVESGNKENQTIRSNSGSNKRNEVENKSDSRVISGHDVNSGIDTVSETGRKYDSLINEYLTIFMSAEYIDFLEIVYADCDKVLTCPFYVR